LADVLRSIAPANRFNDGQTEALPVKAEEMEAPRFLRI